MRMNEAFTLLYRSRLDSCNYSCFYCPFAHRTSSKEELESDRIALEQFTRWIAGRPETFRIFFTPRGEALIHPHYQEAIAFLSRLENVRQTVIQTNLSADLDFLKHCRPDRAAFWCTWHPEDAPMEEFLEKIITLRDGGFRVSTGAVGIRENIMKLKMLREKLPKDIYLWINAFKHDPDYYKAADLKELEAIDPHFRLNLRPFDSRGEDCETGKQVFSVSENGDLARCHFSGGVTGNLYQQFPPEPVGEPCPEKECRCYIGAIFLPSSGLGKIFGNSRLVRIPDIFLTETESRQPQPD
jgi:hypothetical protein